MVEIDGIHLNNKDIHMISKNKAPGFKFRGHEIRFDIAQYT